MAGGIINEDMILRAIEHGIGGVTIGTYAKKPLSTHPRPWIKRIPGTNCYANAYGIRHSYKEKKNFIEKTVGYAKKHGSRIICSYVEKAPEDSIEIVKYYDEIGCDIIEFNPTPLIMGCSGGSWRESLSNERLLVDRINDYLRIAREYTEKPLSIKFPSTINNIVKAWDKMRENGAVIAHIMNAVIPALLLDDKTGRPVLGSPSGTGGLTGECIKPLSLARVYDLSRNGEKNIIGTGGVMEEKDVKDYLMAGATIVGLHTILYAKGIKMISKLIRHTTQ